MRFEFCSHTDRFVPEYRHFVSTASDTDKKSGEISQSLWREFGGCLVHALSDDIYLTLYKFVNIWPSNHKNKKGELYWGTV